MQGMGRKIWAVLGILLGVGEALKGFWRLCWGIERGRKGCERGVRWLRRCSITIFLDFLDFSIVLFLLGSWFFRNIAGEYFWLFLPIRFQ